jgi:ssDNA-binding Zn-finger/Zn-ribbon topoisomerase 1
MVDRESSQIMTQEEQEKSNQEKSYRIREVFDQILAQHFERLIGSKTGINGLPLDLVTVSCFVLFTERENEISNFPDKPPTRYTNETLFKELRELGLDQNEDVTPSLQDMIAKGYLQYDPQTGYTALKPVISMVQLLDKIFPKMPGMNLIAYFIQTIDEIQSGRKDVDVGAKRFHIVLSQQGQALKPVEPKAAKPLPPTPPKKTPEVIKGQGKTVAEALNIDLSQLSKLNEAILKSRDLQSANVLAAKTQPKNIEVKKVEMVDLASLAEPPVPPAPPVEQPATTETTVSSDSSASAITTAPYTEKPTEPESFEEEEDSEAEETPETRPVESGPVEDDSIARQIAAFQEDLALQCPLCRTGKVKTQKTATGSTFFRCTAEGCNFISWGQPYYLACPQCQNPFLIEATQPDGTLILKCPRATCRYWQKHPVIAQSDQPKLVRRVVRRPKRRVVRRIVKK